MSKPVFIYSSWRTASTWIWKKFRDQKNAYAYCEIYHDELASGDMESITKIGPQSWKASRHPDSAPYFLEFTPLFSPGKKGIEGMTPDMVLEKMFPPVGDSLRQEETDYLNRLITVAESAEKIPVLTCTRNLGRAMATRLSFPDGVHIATVRNLWHQWMSFCNQHHLGYSWFLEQLDQILRAAPANDPMLAHIIQRFPPAQDLSPGNPPTARLFYAFIGLHLYLYARAFQAADLVVDINRLADDSCYRREIETRIYELTDLPVDLSDVSCRIEYGPTPIPSLQELRAHIEPLMLVAYASTKIKADDKAGCELRRIVDELYDEVKNYDFYTSSLRNEYIKMAQACNRTRTESVEFASRKEDGDNHRQLHTEALNRHSANLDSQQGTLSGHTTTLHTFEDIIAGHTVALKNNSETLISQSTALQSHAGTLNSHATALDIHARTLVDQSVELKAYSEKLQTHTRTLATHEQKLVSRAASLDVAKRKNLELETRIRRIERRFDKGPLHLRQIFRHPMAFASDVLGLKKRSGKIRFSHLKEGYVDENKSAYLSLNWILRQPGKASILFSRHPRKALRFILRQPKKFLAAGLNKSADANKIKAPQELKQVSVTFNDPNFTGLYIHRKPLFVAVDLTPMRPGGANGGNKYATLALLDALGKSKNHDFRFCYITSSISHHEVQAIARPQDKLVCVNHNGPFETPLGEAPRERDLPGAHDDFLTESDANVLYCPFGDVRFGHPGLPAIVTIVDLLFKDWPHSLTSEEINHREQYVSRSISRADRILCISRTVMDRIRIHYPESKAKLFYSYLPIHERLSKRSPSRSANDGKPYFFFPANFWKHKNHEVLLVSYQIYRSKAGPDAWDLVLSGSEDSRTEEIRRLAIVLEISDSVRFMGFVTDDELAKLYVNAGALVFPSLHEGFGIPPVEAMSFGIPMIIGDAYSTPEICGNACIKVNPRKPQDLAEAMLKLSSEPDLARNLVKLGRLRLKLFNLDAEAEKLARELWLLVHSQEKQYAVGFPDAECSRLVLPTPKNPDRWTFSIKMRSSSPARLSLYIGERPFGSYSPEHYDGGLINLTCEPRGESLQLVTCGIHEETNDCLVASVSCSNSAGDEILLYQENAS